MTEPLSPIASESLPPSSARLRILLLGLATVVLLAVVGAIWAVVRQDVSRPQLAAAVLAEGDHAAASTHSEAESHEAESYEVEANTGGEHGGDHPPASTEHATVEKHEAVEEHEHAEAESSARAADEVAHSEAGGHGSEAAPVSAQTKQVVLSGVAGINILVVLAAAFFRRQNPPRLPKYLQPLKQGSQP